MLAGLEVLNSRLRETTELNEGNGILSAPLLLEEVGSGGFTGRAVRLMYVTFQGTRPVVGDCVTCEGGVSARVGKEATERAGSISSMQISTEAAAKRQCQGYGPENAKNGQGDRVRYHAL